MPKQKRKGFMSVELVIVAGIILFTGIAGIATMGSMGSSTVKSGLNKLDLLGIFSDEVKNGVNNEVPEENNDPVVGYPEGLTITPDMINPEADFVFEWDDALSGWNVKAYINEMDKDVVIPLGKEGQPVVRIGDNAFANQGLASVVIPDTVVTIGANAFLNNNLTSPTNSGLLGFNKLKPVNGIIFTGAENSEPVAFVLPSDLISIGESAFKGNKLTTIELPQGLKVISNNAFENNQLNELKLPSTLLTLGTQSFKGNLLTSVTFEGVKPTLGTGIFMGNPTLLDSSILVPSNQYSEYLMATSKLGVTGSKITVNPNDMNLESDFVFIWDTTTNGWSITGYLNNERKDIIIPSTRADGLPITVIANDTFKGKGLISLVLPEGLKTIGARAFSTNLIVDLIIPNSVTTIGESSFLNNKLETLIMGSGVTRLEGEAFRGNPFTSIQFLGARPTYVGTSPTKPFGNVLILNGNVRVASQYYQNYSTYRPGDFGFATGYQFGVLEEDINLENGLGYAWNSTYNGWEVIVLSDWVVRDVIIPDVRLDGLPVVSIAANALMNHNLTSVKLSKNLVNIGNNAFQNNQLTSLVLPDGLKTIGASAFSANQIADLVIPNSVTTIGESSFLNNKLKTLVVGSGVTRVEGEAFRGNPFTSIQFLGARPSYISNTPSRPFSSVIIPSGSVKVAAQHHQAYATNDAFGFPTGYQFGILDNDPNLENGLGYIWNSTYNGWEVVGINDKTIKDVVIPSNRIDGKPVVSISAKAFTNHGLNSIILPSGLKSVGANAFDTNNITSLLIPETVVSIGNQAFKSNKLVSVKFFGPKPSSLPTSSSQGVFYSNATLLDASVYVPSVNLSSYQTYASSAFGLTSAKFVGY